MTSSPSSSSSPIPHMDSVTFSSPIPSSLPLSHPPATPLDVISPTNNKAVPPASSASNRIHVTCRIRPLSGKGTATVEAVDSSRVRYTDKDGKAIVQSFNAIFGPDCDQERVMQDIGVPLAMDCLRGISGAILCYGQTGSGKTHTMQGGNTDDTRGLIPRVLSHLFTIGSEAPYSRLQLSCSLTEISGDKVRDLLQLGGDFERFEKAAEPVMTAIRDAAHARQLISAGQSRRSVARTNMNDASSRTHALLTLACRCVRDGREARACITLVDLAGSERMGNNAEAQQREGIGINSSLTALNSVLQALIQGQAHVPWRNSTLTQMLEPLLDPKRGTGRTVLVFHVSPELSNASDMRSTLQFAKRCKHIKAQQLVANCQAMTLEGAVVDYFLGTGDVDAEKRRKATDDVRRMVESFLGQESAPASKRRRLDPDVPHVAEDEEAGGRDSEAVKAAEVEAARVRLLEATVRLLLWTVENGQDREGEKDQADEERRLRDQAVLDNIQRQRAESRAAFPMQTTGKENAGAAPSSPVKPMSSPQRTRAAVTGSPGSGLQSPSRAPLSSIQAIIVAANTPKPAIDTPKLKPAVFDYVQGELALSGSYRFPSLDADANGVIRSPIRASLVR